jgi:hypothetical protein
LDSVQKSALAIAGSATAPRSIPLISAGFHAAALRLDRLGRSERRAGRFLCTGLGLVFLAPNSRATIGRVDEQWIITIITGLTRIEREQ